MIPILNPAGVQELIDYGLYGFALSRFCGTWAALKCVKDNIEFDGVRRRPPRPGQDRDPGRRRVPHAAGRPQHPHAGRHPRAGGAAPRLQARRHAGLRAREQPQPHRPVRRAQPEDRHRSRSARAISTCARRSTSSASTRSRRTTWGCGSTRSPAPGRCRKRELVEFARGLELIIVVEEKRSLIEVQVREELYGTAEPAGLHRQEGRERQLAVPGQGRARPQRHRHRHRRAAAAIPRQRRSRTAACRA